jgi:hypothetical protein
MSGCADNHRNPYTSLSWRACIERNGDYVEKWYCCVPLSFNKLNLKNIYSFHLTHPRSRKNFRQGGVCIFIKKNVQFSKINNMVNCKEKDLELCAIQLNLLNMCIVCLYRASSGDFLYFIKNVCRMF